MEMSQMHTGWKFGTAMAVWQLVKKTPGPDTSDWGQHTCWSTTTQEPGSPVRPSARPSVRPSVRLSAGPWGGLGCLYLPAVDLGRYPVFPGTQ